MSANMRKILIIGATSGLGEGFARRLHAQGKRLIITGRRQDRLDGISSSIGTSDNPVETLQWDISDLSGIPTTAEKILKTYPDLDTIFVNAGLQRVPQFDDPSSTSDVELINEITTNVTAPVLLARAFIPHLISVASQGNHAAFMATSSGLAFSPIPMGAVYCATKAAVHSFLVSLRQQIALNKDPNVHKYLSICEIVPPYVDTELDSGRRNPNNPKPMPLEEYLNDAMSKLDAGEEGGKLKKEIPTGTAEFRLEAWRGSIGKIITERFGMKE